MDESIDDLYVRGLQDGDVEPIITAMRRGLDIHRIPDADFDRDEPTHHSIINDAIVLNSPVLNSLVELGVITAPDLMNRQTEIAEFDAQEEAEGEYIRRYEQAYRSARRRRDPNVVRRTVNRRGEERWFLGDTLHREDGPAVIHPDGSRAWFKNGFLHREDGPAFIRANGTEEWYRHGDLHRADGPAITRPDGTDREMWYTDGRLTRVIREDGVQIDYVENGARYTHPNGLVEWWSNGDRHREDGPAVIHPDGTQEWWIHGERQRSEGPQREEQRREIEVVNNPDGTREEWFNGRLLRIVHPNGMNEVFEEGEREPTIEWLNEDGETHREDGPAIISPDGSAEWWIDGEHIRSEAYNHEAYREWEEIQNQREDRQTIHEARRDEESEARERAESEAREAWREGERQAEIETQQLAREYAELRTLSFEQLRVRLDELEARATNARRDRETYHGQHRYQRLRAIADRAEALYTDEFVRRRQAEADRLAREYEELYAPDPEIERAQTEAERLAREYQELYAPDPEIERRQEEADRSAREYQELYAPDPEIERRQEEADRLAREQTRAREQAERVERERQKEAEKVERERQKETERVERERQKEVERVEREREKLEKKLEREGLLDYYKELETSGYEFPQTHKEILEHVQGYKEAREEAERVEAERLRIAQQALLYQPSPVMEKPPSQTRQQARPVREFQQRHASRQAMPNLVNQFHAQRQDRLPAPALVQEFQSQRQAQQQARQTQRDSLAREFAELERRQNMERVFMEQQIQPLTNPVEIDAIVREFNNKQAYERAVLENRAMDFERAFEDEDADFHARREHEAQFLPFDEQTEGVNEHAYYGPQADHREPQIRLPSGQVNPPRGVNPQGQVRLVMQQPAQQPAPQRNFIRGPASEYVPRAPPAMWDYDPGEQQGGRRGMEVAGMRGAYARRY
jgi:hypothetical protein